jgi:hypothetical protein
MSRPTPETDAQGWGDGLHPWVATDFARKLERERDEAREALRSVLELAEDIPDEALDAWKNYFHTILEAAK